MNNPEKKRYIPGVVLGVIGIVFSVLFPAVSYGCSIPGLVCTAKKNKKEYKKGAGIALNIIALVIALANSVVAVVLTAVGFSARHKGEV